MLPLLPSNPPPPLPLHQLAFSSALVRHVLFAYTTRHSLNLHTVLHAQGGNIAEHLVANGLARVVDWHAGMLAAGGAMERLRQAERAAKEKRLKLYASAPTPAAKSNGGVALNGNARNFDAVVTRVWSGDQISVAEKDGAKERRIQLSSTRAPK